MTLKKVLGTLAVCCSMQGIAGSMSDDFTPQLSFGWGPGITFSAGPAWPTYTKHTPTVTYNDPTNTFAYALYTPETRAATLGVGALFFALQKETWPGVLTQLGIQIAGTTNMEMRGLVSVNGFPALYGYSYKVNHARVGLESKFIFKRVPYVQPYIDLGIAISFNHAKSFYNTALVNNPFYPPQFAAHTTNGFSYQIGLGVQKEICRNWQLGVGYEFSTLGKVNLGADPFNPYYGGGWGLPLTNLYNHVLKLSVGYFW